MQDILQSVLMATITRERGFSDRYRKYRPRIDRLEMSRSARLFLPASYCGRCGRYFYDF
jgi:hypothetical protein